MFSGITPVTKFLDMSKRVIPFKLSSPLEILPDIWFDPNIGHSSLLEKLETEGGNSPSNWSVLIYNNWNPLQLLKEVIKLKPLSSKFVSSFLGKTDLTSPFKFPRFRGRDPEKLLLAKSSSTSPVALGSRYTCEAISSNKKPF